MEGVTDLYLVGNLKLSEKIPALVHTFYRGRKDGRQFEENIKVSKMNMREMKEVVEYIFYKYLQEVDGDGEESYACDRFISET